MGKQIDTLVDRIRAAQGPFFIARIGLRLSFPLAGRDVPDSAENIRAILQACRDLGFDATPLATAA